MNFEVAYSSYYFVFYFQLQEYVEGLIEVQGRVNEMNEIECTSYVLFPGQAENFGRKTSGGEG